MPENRLTVPINPARALRELNRQAAPEPAVTPLPPTEPLVEVTADENVFDSSSDDLNSGVIDYPLIRRCVHLPNQ